ncbi:PQQ-binding-like beta-propeller repeat protein [Mucilaginibacter sp. PPCGB 2223]|uniref:outer membrane protein assembly factor BamB family protein n=1 Tax=Mucilaginibacter sp. PPCGB 2223 TaxID=1886027 RepID=UPI0015868B79|nr:PQQ-binding-like beta-propeller repeat protein [Mucilaginibacter sp. PPCGB 2223]
MRIYVCCFGILVILFSGCKKNSSPVVPTDKPIGAFTVTVADRGANYAVINWTQATTVDPKDAVTYTVILGSDTILLNKLQYTVTPANLTPNAYHGKVIARNSQGSAMVDTFYVSAFNGYFLGFSFSFSYSKYTLSANYSSLWSFPSSYNVPMGGSYYSYNTPAISGDTLFIGESKVMTALSLKTGTRLWSVATTGSSQSSVLYDKGMVYTATDAQKMIAINTSNHTVKWTFDAPVNTTLLTEPIIVNNTLYFCSSNSLFAIDAATGIKKWSYYFVNGDNVANCSTPTSDGVNIYFTVMSTRSMLSLNAQSGTLNWQYIYGTQAESIFLNNRNITQIHNGVILQTLGPKTIAVNATTGSLLWNVPTSCNPGFRGDTVYMCYSGKMHALNIKTGTQIWQSADAFDVVYNNGYNSDIVVVGNKLYASGNNCLLTEVNADTGKTSMSISSYAAGLYVVFPVVILNNKTYYGNSSAVVR